jgi:hypothetical protein
MTVLLLTCLLAGAAAQAFEDQGRDQEGLTPGGAEIPIIGASVLATRHRPCTASHARPMQATWKA